MSDRFPRMHINLNTYNDDSVSVEIEGDRVKVVFRIGETKFEKVLGTLEALNEGRAISEAGVYHAEGSISGEVASEFGRRLKDCGELLLNA